MLGGFRPQGFQVFGPVVGSTKPPVFDLLGDLGTAQHRMDPRERGFVCRSVFFEVPLQAGFKEKQKGTTTLGGALF